MKKFTKKFLRDFVESRSLSSEKIVAIGMYDNERMAYVTKISNCLVYQYHFALAFDGKSFDWYSEILTGAIYGFTEKAITEKL